MAGRNREDLYDNYNVSENYFQEPDLITQRLPLHFHKEMPEYTYPKPYENKEDFTISHYIGSGVTFVSLITENLLCHPFLVLRRQCQVNHTSKVYHLQPFTLLPTICRLHHNQGLTTLWKGLGSVLLVRGMSLGVEDLVSKVTPWPKEITWHSSVRQFCQHTLLKCVSLAIVTPFYCASFVETVQSEISSERPGILDVFREGFLRLLNWSAPAKGRMLPIWALIVPTITLGLAKYLFSMLVKSLTVRIISIRQKNRWEEIGTIPKDISNLAAMQHINLTASLVATISSDIMFYPCETIVHRLHLQGTRTIIDNLSDGKSVLPILTNYSGALDCYEKCLATEGTAGLYKGFGALILQYVAHIALIKLTHLLLSEFGSLLKKPKPKYQLKDNSPPVISNVTNPPKSYLLP
ncbi:mitochondrial outer membrane protein SLC25A46-like [Anthonomus grandis grandis]|uniref:mitochondrial outer membrane protein SLC25A46-like n=1 Tax=Anthonomus grandis grandis TaxID=2921223 RepID=UPI0021665833|nr:mitochondrial outer membrane protein SLC25A46-like [Anthonomus grandis grandis]